MYQVILSIHILISIVLVVLVLVQQGRGGGMGSAFGSGASQTVFGSRGSGSFLLKFTGSVAAAFFATSITLGYLANQQVSSVGGLDLSTPPAASIPVEDSQSPVPSGDDLIPLDE